MTNNDFETMPTGSMRAMSEKDIEIEGLKADCDIWKAKADLLESALKHINLRLQELTKQIDEAGK